MSEANQFNDSQYPWQELQGMTEDQAEYHMSKKWGVIPKRWFDPIERDIITNIVGQAELEAHMNFGELAYGGESRHGEEAGVIWYKRNIEGQGHPAEKGWVGKQQKQKKEK